MAIHTLTHPFLEQMPKERIAFEVLEDKRRLEKLFGYTIRGMAYPYGTTNDETIEILKNTGIIYARNIGISHSFDIPDNWYRLTATTRNTDPKIM